MKVLIVHRRHQGHSSTKALSELLETLGGDSMVWRNDRSFLPVSRWLGNADFKVVRWGCTATIPTTGLSSCRYVQRASGIHAVNDKLGFLQKLSLLDNQQGILPVLSSGSTITDDQADNQQWVVRPPTHSQGRNLRVMHTSALSNLITSGWRGYARPLVQKKAEYRVFVMNGKAVNVVKKTPSNPSDVAWNVAQGGRFDNVRWGDWPINVVDLACRISQETGLNLTGMDIMVDHDDNAWFIEANSAPSLPYNSDGSHTYRQKCVAKGIAYTLDNPEVFPYTKGETWRDYVHPAIYGGETQ